MDYIIYGAGYRGKRALEAIGEKYIQAFIDLDTEKQGKMYSGKPIISLTEYLEHYKASFIIISPAFCSDIELRLEENEIFQYSNLSDLPLELAGYGECEFEEYYKDLKNYNGKKMCIYGLTALSFLIYDFIRDSANISICIEKGCSQSKIQWVKKYYPEIKIKTINDIQYDEIILMSIVEKEKGKFSNTVINLFDYIHINNLYHNQKIMELKNRYINKKRCFIVATGPSLNIDDLYTLTANHEFCFSVNRIIHLQKQWVADAYVVSDSNFISNNIKNIKNYKCKMKFIGDSCKEYWEKTQDDSYKIHVTTAGNGVDFSNEIEKKVYAGYVGGGTVTYVCIQLAVYMGFTEIYLLGVDCNYVMGSKHNYFIGDQVSDNKDHKEKLMIKAYECAKRYADAHGIKIYNATRGGMLEVFERVDFDSLF